MSKYVVYIPSYEVTVEATDEMDAFDNALQEIAYEDVEINLVLDAWE